MTRPWLTSRESIRSPDKVLLKSLFVTRADAPHDRLLQASGAAGQSDTHSSRDRPMPKPSPWGEGFSLGPRQVDEAAPRQLSAVGRGDGSDDAGIPVSR